MNIITETIRVTNQFLRNPNQIKRIGIHNTGVDRSNIDCRESLNRHRLHWRSLGWTNCGYHEIIARDGRVFILHNPNHVANGVGDHNNDSYHIAVEGLGNNVTAAQRRVLLERIKAALSEFNIPLESVLGHNEFANTPRFDHRSNSCPNMNMATVRNDVKSLLTPSLPRKDFTLTNPVRGFVTADDAKNNRNPRTDLAPGDYWVFRKHDGMYNITLTHGQPGSWMNPAHDRPATNQPKIIRIGSLVRINQGARTWATGQAIPAWVIGRQYPVTALRNNNTEVLLGNGINSWVRVADITLL